nr:MAG TPA: hypothetical protein [Caudoviricetes sp.]
MCNTTHFLSMRNSLFKHILIVVIVVISSL